MAMSNFDSNQVMSFQRFTLPNQGTKLEQVTSVDQIQVGHVYVDLDLEEDTRRYIFVLQRPIKDRDGKWKVLVLNLYFNTFRVILLEDRTVVPSVTWKGEELWNNKYFLLALEKQPKLSLKVMLDDTDGMLSATPEEIVDLCLEIFDRLLPYPSDALR